MPKIVQRVRHASAAALAYVGRDGEITVDQTNKSVRVHDGINAGGTEQARADLNNVSVASSGNDGKMSAAQAVQLAQAVIDIAANLAAIASNDTDIAALQSGKVDAVSPSVVDNVVTFSDLVGAQKDSGVAITDLFTVVAAASKMDVIIPAADVNIAVLDGVTGQVEDGGQTIAQVLASAYARANHTGTQIMATISDAGSLATKNNVAQGDLDPDIVDDSKIDWNVSNSWSQSFGTGTTNFPEGWYVIAGPSSIGNVQIQVYNNGTTGWFNMVDYSTAITGVCFFTDGSGSRIRVNNSSGGSVTLYGLKFA